MMKDVSLILCGICLIAGFALYHFSCSGDDNRALLQKYKDEKEAVVRDYGTLSKMFGDMRRAKEMVADSLAAERKKKKSQTAAAVAEVVQNTQTTEQAVTYFLANVATLSTNPRPFAGIVAALDSSRIAADLEAWHYIIEVNIEKTGADNMLALCEGEAGSLREALMIGKSQHVADSLAIARLGGIIDDMEAAGRLPLIKGVFIEAAVFGKYSDAVLDLGLKRFDANGGVTLQSADVNLDLIPAQITVLDKQTAFGFGARARWYWRP